MSIDQNVIVIALGAVIVLLFAAIGWLVRIELRFKKLFRGRAVKDLESALSQFSKELNDIQRWAEKSHDSIENLEKELKKSARHVGIVRFNPFKDVGGDQSFAIALLDDNKNGVVFSSLYDRNSNRIYAKPVTGGESKYQFSEEEKSAIAQATSQE